MPERSALEYSECVLIEAMEAEDMFVGKGTTNLPMRTRPYISPEVVCALQRVKHDSVLTRNSCVCEIV